MQTLADYADIPFFKKLANKIGLVHRLNDNGFTGYVSISRKLLLETIIQYCTVSSLKYRVISQDHATLNGGFIIDTLVLKDFDGDSTLYISIVTDDLGNVSCTITESED